MTYEGQIHFLLIYLHYEIDSIVVHPPPYLRPVCSKTHLGGGARQKTKTVKNRDTRFWRQKVTSVLQLLLLHDVTENKAKGSFFDDTFMKIKTGFYCFSWAKCPYHSRVFYRQIEKRQKKTNKTTEPQITAAAAAAAHSWRPSWSVAALAPEGELNYKKARKLRVCVF